MKKFRVVLFLFVIKFYAVDENKVFVPKIQKFFEQIFDYSMKIPDDQLAIQFDVPLKEFDQNIQKEIGDEKSRSLYSVILEKILREKFNNMNFVDLPHIINGLKRADFFLKRLFCDNESIYDTFVIVLNDELKKRKVDLTAQDLINYALLSRAPRPTPDSVSLAEIVGAHSYLPGLDQAVQAALEATIATLNEKGSLILQRLTVRETAKIYNLEVVRQSQHQADLTIDGNLTVNGNSYLGNQSSDLNVLTGVTNINTSGTAATTIGNTNSTVNVSGGINNVTGTTNINTTSSAATNIAVGGTGPVNIGNTTGGINVIGAVTLSGSITLTGTITAASLILSDDLTVYGNTSLGDEDADTIDIHGVTNINTAGVATTNIGNTTGGTAITGNMSVSGVATLSETNLVDTLTSTGEIYQVGVTTLSNTTLAGTTLNSGTITSSGAIFNSGVTTLTGLTTLSDTIINGVATVNGTLTSGSAIFNSGPTTLTGLTTLSDTSINGVVTVNGTLTSGSAIFNSGSTTLTGLTTLSDARLQGVTTLSETNLVDTLTSTGEIYQAGLMTLSNTKLIGTTSNTGTITSSGTIFNSGATTLTGLTTLSGTKLSGTLTSTGEIYQAGLMTLSNASLLGTLNVNGATTMTGALTVNTTAANNVPVTKAGTGLWIVRGVVESNGTKGRGEGYSSLRDAQGKYSVTFTNAFGVSPVVVLTAERYADGAPQCFARLRACATTGFTAWLLDENAVNQDSAFCFIAIGPS